MSGVGFGSVGDIIAVASLAYQIAQALSESRGSSAEYQELIIELDALSSALTSLDEVINRHPLDVAVRNAIKYSVARCWSLMTNFSSRIDGYKSSLQKREKGKGSGYKWKNVWRSIGWMLFKKEELVDLREKLSEQKATITMMLTLSQCASLNKVETRIEEKISIANPAPTPPSKAELAEYIQQVIESQRADTQKSYQEVLTAMKQTAQEQVPFNLQGYMDEFSKSIASEVRILLGEVGRLREERSQLQHDVSELLSQQSRLGSQGDRKPPGAHSPPPPMSETGHFQEKSKYEPGAFDDSWRTTRYDTNPPPPVDDMEATTPPPSFTPGWNPPQRVDIQPSEDWSEWQPTQGHLPSPPPQYSGRTSSGLFGPRE